MCLQALGAEVIVTFEGTSESGAQFMTRQSYLPSEMHWGYVFSEIIFHAKEGETEHSVDISRSTAACLPVPPHASNSYLVPSSCFYSLNCLVLPCILCAVSVAL